MILVLENMMRHVLKSTVRSRYLGSKKPLGGFYHYKDMGSFFSIFLDKYGIKLYVMIFLSFCVV